MTEGTGSRRIVSSHVRCHGSPEFSNAAVREPDVSGRDGKEAPAASQVALNDSSLLPGRSAAAHKARLRRRPVPGLPGAALQPCA